MNNTISVRLISLFIPAAWMFHSAALARQDPGEGALTNGFLFPSNGVQPQPINTALAGTAIPGNGVLGNPLLGTSALGGFAGPPQAVFPTGPGLLHDGPVNLYPQARYQFAYGNSLQATPGHRIDTAIDTLSPGLLATWKTNWSLLFVPSLVFYSNPAFRNATEYAVSLVGGTAWRDWTLRLAQGYSQTDSPLIETGSQTELTAYTTALDGIYQMGPHFSVELGVNQTFRSAESLSDLWEWTTADWLNYQTGPAFGAGLGVILGYDQVSQSSDMPFEQLQARIVFAPGQKLSFRLSGGVEDRQFIDPDAPSLVTPIFSGVATWQLFESSTITAQASRTLTPSLYANEINTHAIATAGWRQRLLKNLYLDVTGTYSSEPYTSIEPGPLPEYYFGVPPSTTLQVTRVDTSATLSFSLTCAIRRRLSANIFYDLNKVDSSQSSFTLSTSQVGFSLTYSY